MPRYYPVFLDISGRRCAVFGGNHEAERKALYLLECGARPVVFSPEADTTETLKALARSGSVDWQNRTYQQGDLENVWIAIVADTSDPARNERLFTEARSRNVPLNTLDVTPMCTFIAPAIVQRKDVTVAISTAGTSPALARKLRVEMSSHGCLCMRWADVGPVIADARKDVRASAIVVCPEVWQDFLTPAWLADAENDPAMAKQALVTGIESRACVACAPHGRCQKHG